MSSKPNLVIGAGYNLNWDQCKVWVNSLNASGFSGKKILVYFGNNKPLFDILKDKDIDVAVMPDLPPSENVCNSRFLAYHALLKTFNWMDRFNWVIATDVTDVVFQKNPEDFLYSVDFIADDKPFDHIASSENLVYGKEPWGANNLNLTYGLGYYRMMEHKTIWNAGVIAASHQRMADLSGIIFEMGQGKTQHVPGGGGPDQATYNVLMNMPSINNQTRFASHNSGWACQCGTTMDQSRPWLLQAAIEPLPTFNGEYVVTNDGNPYHIVHQYNRIPELKEYFERKYDV